jgi:two-component system, NarL family, invasion response regulator UvrY
MCSLGTLAKNMVRKIALVEDSILVRESLRRMLVDIADFEIVGEYDHAAAAIAGITEHLPHLILLDLRLRDSNGMQVLKHVKRSHPNVFVIVFSSQSDPINRIRAFAAGADMFLSKTDDIDRLNDVLTEFGAIA